MRGMELKGGSLPVLQSRRWPVAVMEARSGPSVGSRWRMWWHRRRRQGVGVAGGRGVLITFVSLAQGVMDQGDKFQQVQRILVQWGEKFDKNKADWLKDLNALQIERFEAEVTTRVEQTAKDDYVSRQREEFDKAEDTEHSELAKRLRTEVVALLNRVLNDQRKTYAKMIKQERILSDVVLKKSRQEYNATIKEERKISDSLIEKARAHLVDMENDHEKLKTSIQSLMINPADVRANAKEEEDMIHIPLRLMPHIIDNECRPDIVMKFKLHGVKEKYPDLQKYYDSREQLADIAITDPKLVAFWFLSQHLTKYYGYKGDAEWYYRNPSPGSQELVKIDGPEDVVQMVDAHANQGTKICHMYIVNGAGFYDKDGFPWRDEDEDGYPYHYDEGSTEDEAEEDEGNAEDEAEQDDKSPVKKQRPDE